MLLTFFEGFIELLLKNDYFRLLCLYSIGDFLLFFKDFTRKKPSMNIHSCLRIVTSAVIMSFSLAHAQPNMTYLLKLKFPQTFTETPGLSGCYKGNPLDLREQ